MASPVAMNNGQSGNANTDTAAECSNPPYATHVWVAEQALMLLPQTERDWLMPFRAVYLIGTEAPDFKHIPAACQTPRATTTAARVTASSGPPRAQHSQGPPFETLARHSAYERFVARRTASFGAADFQSFIVLDSLVRRSAYTAVKRISRVTARGEGVILSAAQMESLSHSLNLGANVLADVLHTFFLNVVSDDD